MKLYSENEQYKLYQGNMLDMLEVIEPSSIDSIITDPPYELNFMGKGWDNSGIAFQSDTWQKCYEVLKPGGYLLAFGGSRTFHRIACAIENAGFEIRDTIMWLYGSGFPKSMNIGLQFDKREGLQGQRGIGGFNVGGIQEQQNRKAKLYIGSTTDGSKQQAYTDYKGDLARKWQGWGTALKPSYEPIIVARKPFKGSLVDNVIENGVGGINIDECRVGNEERTYKGMSKHKPEGAGTFRDDNWEPKDIEVSVNGRFPANTILTYDETDFDEVCGGFPNTKSTLGPAYYKGNYTKNGWKNTSKQNTSEVIYNDSGSASRYFYCAKASKKDRDCNGTIRNIHPTCKPCNLMQYLVRLVTPNGGTVLDPFNGSGSTGKAVMYENKERNKNYKYIGIELTEEYLPISKARIEYVCNLEEEIKERQTSLFDD